MGQLGGTAQVFVGVVPGYFFFFFLWVCERPVWDTPLSSVDSWVSCWSLLPHCGALGVNGLSGHLTELCGLQVSCWSPLPQFGVLGVDAWSVRTPH